jgi:acetyl-CoA C-acetyltransferase
MNLNSVPDPTPIIVGAGQHHLVAFDPTRPCAPVDLAAGAAQQALADSGRAEALRASIDTVAFVRLFADMGWAPSPFGRSTKPPRSLARRLGIDPPHAVYSAIGGNAPQMLVNEYAERINRGECTAMLLAGGETQRTSDDAVRQGIALDWNEDPPGTCEERGADEDQVSKLVSMYEIIHGLDLPAASYALFDNALRARRGASHAAHLASMSRLCARLSAVAARNPLAAFPTRRSAADIAGVTAENRWISYPYTKWMVANNRVDQAAAVVMTSVGHARSLGIDPSRWVFVRGCGDVNDKMRALDHVNFHSAPAIGIAGRRALAMAGIGIGAVDFFDLYSCFPIAVELACAELGLAEDDPRDLTVTGGLPYFGGPLNAYSLHAIAETVSRLRHGQEKYGLVTANGGLLSKQSVGIYSTVPGEGEWRREDPTIAQAELDAMASPRIEEQPAGIGSIETYTVICERGRPARGVIVGRLLEGDARFLANTPADRPEILAWLMEGEPLGVTGVVRSADGSNIFIPQPFQ